MNVTIRIVDYRALRRSYVRWRCAHPTILAWYVRWMDHWNRSLQSTGK